MGDSPPEYGQEEGGSGPRREAHRPPGPLLVNLKEIREEQGWSVRELGRRSGVHYVTVTVLENLRRGADGKTVRKLARALATTPETLAGGGVMPDEGRDSGGTAGSGDRDR